MIHELKTEKAYFNAVLRKEKTFEIRYNDRFYQKGDKLVLRETEGTYYTGAKITVEVLCITNYNQKDGWCVMGIRICDDQTDKDN